MTETGGAERQTGSGRCHRPAPVLGLTDVRDMQRLDRAPVGGRQHRHADHGDRAGDHERIGLQYRPVPWQHLVELRRRVPVHRGLCRSGLPLRRPREQFQEIRDIERWLVAKPAEPDERCAGSCANRPSFQWVARCRTGKHAINQDAVPVQREHAAPAPIEIQQASGRQLRQHRQMENPVQADIEPRPSPMPPPHPAPPGACGRPHAAGQSREQNIDRIGHRHAGDARPPRHALPTP